MNCPWVRSANPNDPLSTVCDLSQSKVECRGEQSRCQFPNLLDAEMTLEYEREKEIDAHGIWIDMVQEERYIRTGR